MILIATHRGDCPMTRAASNIRGTVRSRSIIHRPAFENGELCVYLVLASSRRSRSRNPSRIPRRTIRRPVNGLIDRCVGRLSERSNIRDSRKAAKFSRPNAIEPDRFVPGTLRSLSVSNRSLIEHFSPPPSKHPFPRLVRSEPLPGSATPRKSPRCCS